MRNSFSMAVIVEMVNSWVWLQIFQSWQRQQSENLSCLWICLSAAQTLTCQKMISSDFGSELILGDAKIFQTKYASEKFNCSFKKIASNMLSANEVSKNIRLPPFQMPAIISNWWHGSLESSNNNQLYIIKLNDDDHLEREESGEKITRLRRL